MSASNDLNNDSLVKPPRTGQCADAYDTGEPVMALSHHGDAVVQAVPARGPALVIASCSQIWNP